MRAHNVLKLNAGGMPIDLIDPERAVRLMADGRALYSFGDDPIVLRGGRNAFGQTSVLELPPIIAVRDRSTLWDEPEPRRITRRQLVERDRMCLYCGTGLGYHNGTIDHIIPKSRGGSLYDPANWALACKSCNCRKGNRTPEEAGMKLLAVPYRPNPAARILLKGRRIIACQQEYLMRFSNAPVH